MSRRSFLLYFFLWLLSCFFGYRLGRLEKDFSNVPEEFNGEQKEVAEQINHVNNKLTNTVKKLEVLEAKRVNVESFKRKQGETDDTGLIMRAYKTLTPGDTLVIL